jgi:FeS assembly SUF system regulator
MLRLSKLTDYATVLLAILAADPARQYTAAELAERSRIAAPTVSKLLKQLHRSGLLASSRGLRGGYRLARPPQEISAAAILDALEGPLALTECASASSHCELEGNCGVGGAWQRINVAIRQSLQEITLSELAGLERAAGTRSVTFGLRLRSGLNTGAKTP